MSGRVTVPEMLPHEAADGRRRPRDVAFTFSYVHWDGAQQRGMNFAQDRLALTLLDHQRVRRVLVANWFRSAPRYAARRLRPRAGARFPASEHARLHQPVRLRREDPPTLAGVERAYRAYDRSLARAARRFGLRRPAFITMHPLVAGFAPLEWAGPVTFYASDDWTGAVDDFGSWVPLYEEAFRRVRERGHALCAVSAPIVERLRPTGPSLVVPNGIESLQWATPGAAPAWFLSLPGPRLLYVGTLDRRIDLSLVRAAVDANPGGSVVLVGRASDPEHVARCREVAPEVHIRARVPHAQVPGLIHGADACLIPHARTRLTEAMSPLKLYEYLAAGRPVAATDLPPMREVDNRVVLGADPARFAEAVREALRQGPASESERLAFVASNAWHARHEQVLDLALR